MSITLVVSANCTEVFVLKQGGLLSLTKKKLPYKLILKLRVFT